MSNVYILSHGLSLNDFIVLPKHITIYTVVSNDATLAANVILNNKLRKIFTDKNDAFDLLKKNKRDFYLANKSNLANKNNLTELDYNQYISQMNIEKHSQLMHNLTLDFTDPQQNISDTFGVIAAPNLMNNNAFSNLKNKPTTLSEILLYISSINVQNEPLNIILFACRTNKEQFSTAQQMKYIKIKCGTFMEWLTTRRDSSTEQVYGNIPIMYTADFAANEQDKVDLNLLDVINIGYKHAQNRPNKTLFNKYVLSILKIYYFQPFTVKELCAITAITDVLTYLSTNSTSDKLQSALKEINSEWTILNQIEIKNNKIYVHDTNMLCKKHNLADTVIDNLK